PHPPPPSLHDALPICSHRQHHRSTQHQRHTIGQPDLLFPARTQPRPRGTDPTHRQTAQKQRKGQSHRADGDRDMAERAEQHPHAHQRGHQQGEHRTPPRQRRALELQSRTQRRLTHQNNPINNSAATRTIPPVTSGATPGAGSAVPVRSARSLRAQPSHACPPANSPVTINTIDPVNSSPVGIDNSNAFNATPAAKNASAVRIHARNVRSFASENRGSGSSPLPYTRR